MHCVPRWNSERGVKEIKSMNINGRNDQETNKRILYPRNTAAASPSASSRKVHEHCCKT